MSAENRLFYCKQLQRIVKMSKFILVLFKVYSDELQFLHIEIRFTLQNSCRLFLFSRFELVNWPKWLQSTFEFSVLNIKFWCIEAFSRIVERGPSNYLWFSAVWTPKIIYHSVFERTPHLVQLTQLTEYQLKLMWCVYVVFMKISINSIFSKNLNAFRVFFGVLGVFASY